MNATQVVSLVFGFIVTLAGGVFLTVMGFASSLPPGTVA